ncbi:MAG TPA: hypothetical protein DCX46_12685 [Bacteroidetes bacterium]|nr:hypothetical protein [Bacteroidota bacterium]
MSAALVASSPRNGSQTTRGGDCVGEQEQEARMMIDIGSVARVLLAVILFPSTFQDQVIFFAWGMDDDLWTALAKRLFLLLPALAVIAGSWVTIPSLFTVIFRHKRREFMTMMFLAWWDLGKSIVSFWGGVFKFVLLFIGDIIGLLKMIVVGILLLIRDVLFLPFRMVRSAGQSVVRSPVPWIAVFLTVFWCIIEALIFSYVTAPLVVDTLSNVTGEQLSFTMVRIPLFIFLLFVVLGSYAVLSNLVNAVKSKNVPSVVAIVAVEIVVLFVEVVFLYREFVDSLVPWFAQYSEGFELGVFWTLAIACLAWFGIRSVSWFLFASHGTPTILSVIQGKGVAAGPVEVPAPAEAKAETVRYTSLIKEEAEWVRRKGDELLSAFMLPPL